MCPPPIFPFIFFFHIQDLQQMIIAEEAEEKAGTAMEED